MGFDYPFLRSNMNLRGRDPNVVKLAPPLMPLPHLKVHPYIEARMISLDLRLPRSQEPSFRRFRGLYEAFSARPRQSSISLAVSVFPIPMSTSLPRYSPPLIL